MSAQRVTGFWVVRTRIGYLTGLVGSGVIYGTAQDAIVFPTKTAAQHAMEGVLPYGETATYEHAQPGCRQARLPWGAWR